MKKFSFLIIVFTLLSICFCEENIKDNSTNENNEILESGKKKLEISLKLIDYLNSLKNLTEIISNFTDEVFERLADKEKNVIIVENILGKFNISIITDFITRFFSALKIEEILSKFLKASLKIIGDMLLNIFKSTDL